MIVTPYVGVWIETSKSGHTLTYDWSHPTWVCGLKPLLSFFLRLGKVTPYVGVWIETP